VKPADFLSSPVLHIITVSYIFFKTVFLTVFAVDNYATNPVRKLRTFSIHDAAGLKCAVSSRVLVVDGAHAGAPADGAELAAEGRSLGWLSA